MSKISVVILTWYKDAHMMPELLESLVNQTLDKSEYEIIMVSDVTDNETGAAIDEYLKTYPDLINYIRADINSRGLKRNYGARRANSDIILFLDGDMVAKPQLLEEHIKFHEKFDRNVSVLGYFNNVSGMKEKGLNYFNRNFLELMEESSLNNVFADNSGDLVDFRHFYTGNVSVKKEEFEKIGGFDEQFTIYGLEDIDLGYRLQLENIDLYFNKNAETIHRYAPKYLSYVNKKIEAGYSLGFFVDKYEHLYRFYRITVWEAIVLFLTKYLLFIPGLFNSRIIKKQIAAAIRLNLFVGFLRYNIENLRKRLTNLGEFLS